MWSLDEELKNFQQLEKLSEQLHKQYTEITTEHSNVEDKDEELKKLQLENTKYKHRLVILKRAIQNERKLYMDNNSQLKAPENIENMISINNHLADLFTDAIAKAIPRLAGTKAIVTPVVSNTKFGDYQCNSAMALAKTLKVDGIVKTPRDIAENLIKHVQKSVLIDKMEVASAGFINIFLKKSYAVKALTNIVRSGVKPPTVIGQRVVVDFSSPNIAKEMHVGHLRSTIIGESISRFLEFLGHDVLRINHLGDWGTQFGMLIAHLEDCYPDFLNESPSISDLQAFYKESKKRFDEDEEFKKRSYSRVIQLQGGEANATKAWHLICDVSRKEFQKIYNRLEITLTEKGESFYQSLMIEIVKYLDAKNLLEEDEGRKIMWPQQEKTGIPLTIVKSDGGFTYDTSDMAALRYRLEEEKADWVIYVVDAGQQTHLKNIFLASERCGFLQPNRHRIDHVQFGVVLGEDGKKFKTRSGDTVKLSELLDEGLKRSLDKLIEKNRDKVLTREELKAAQESVAYGCIKYADLSHNRINEYVFSFEKMLDDRGNTAVYLLYAYARIRSIARNCVQDSSNIKDVLSSVKLVLDHDKEWKLAKTLLKLPDVLLKIYNDLLLHVLCEFCYEVCTTFSEFYDNCYCIEKNSVGEIVKINYSRILLCEATAIILKQCFHILGLKPLDKI